MSVSSNIARVSVTITALPQIVPIFEFNEETDLIVYDGGSSNAGNDPALVLVLNSDYSVSGGGYNSVNQLQTGNILVNGTGANLVQVGDVITILRNIDPLQDTSFDSTGLQTPLMIEQDDDKVTTLAQQLLDGQTRSIRAPGNENLDWVLPPAPGRVSSFVFFDSAGDLSLLTLQDLLAQVESGSVPVAKNTFLAGPTTGADADPTFRSIVIDDLFGGTGASVSTFLRGDGTWATPPGGGGGSGSITLSGYTQNTATLLGRTTASVGAIQEITVGANLSFSATALNTVQDIQTTSEPQFLRVNLVRADGDYGAIFNSGSRSYGMAVNGTTFLLDDVSASANRIAIDSTGVVYIPNLSAGGFVKALPSTGALVLSAVAAFTSGTLSGLTGLGIRDTSAAFDVTIAATSSTALTAGRTLTLDLVNVARTLKMTGNAVLNQDVTTTGTPTFTRLTTSSGTTTIQGQLCIGTGVTPYGTIIGTLGYAGLTVGGLSINNTDTSGSGTAIQFSQNGGTVVGSVVTTNTTTTYNTSSDVRLKTNIRDFTDSGAMIDGLRPRIWDWRAGEKDCIGFVAQEEFQVCPFAVQQGDSGPTIVKQWQRDDSKLVPILVAELKALRARIALLETLPT